MASSSLPTVRPLGDGALLIAFDAAVDAALNARVLDVASRLSSSCVPGLRDVVPAYASCAVHFDPLRTDRRALESAVRAAIDDSSHRDVPAAAPSTTIVPVCYGGAFGPDLTSIAEGTRLSAEEIVSIHAGRDYRVFMLGFLPGFPYLGVLDSRIAMPRLAVPRTRVPAGSVGVAERQTGIYPVDAPGGWRIIGRTPLRLFDPSAESPARFRPGDTVRFVPIDERQYRAAS
jgi:inhibitor of KinA